MLCPPPFLCVSGVKRFFGFYCFGSQVARRWQGPRGRCPRSSRRRRSGSAWSPLKRSKSRPRFTARPRWCPSSSRRWPEFDAGRGFAPITFDIEIKRRPFLPGRSGSQPVLLQCRDQAVAFGAERATWLELAAGSRNTGKAGELATGRRRDVRNSAQHSKPSAPRSGGTTSIRAAQPVMPVIFRECGELSRIGLIAESAPVWRRRLS